MIEWIDHLHEHFVNPAVVTAGRYQAPAAPGASTQMRPESLAEFSYPAGPVWRDAESCTAERSAGEMSFTILSAERHRGAAAAAGIRPAAPGPAGCSSLASDDAAGGTMTPRWRGSLSRTSPPLGSSRYLGSSALRQSAPTRHPA